MAKRRKVVEAKVLHEFPVKFKKVTVGEDDATVGFSIPREFCILKLAEELFIDRRLTARVVLGRSDDQNGQTLEPPDRDVEVRTTFDSPKFSISKSTISGIKLAFLLKDVALDDIAALSNRGGRLMITAVEDIPHERGEAAHNGQPTPILDAAEAGEWQKIPLPVAMPSLTKGVRQKLADANLRTLGEFTTLVGARGDYWSTEIEGIGPKARHQIEDALEGFWKANPKFTRTAAAAK